MSTIEKAVNRMRSATGRISPHDPTSLADSASVSPTIPSIPTPFSSSRRINLDFGTLERDGFITPETMQGQLAEQYRKLKWPLIKNATTEPEKDAKPLNVIAVTSALPKEGKTYTAFNLAMSIAMERDVTVLLVDGDVIARSLTRMVGLDDAPGITDVLLNRQLTLNNIITATNVPKLRFIPAGRVHQHTTELLASERMRNLIHEIAIRYKDRIILLDTAPILTTNQAIVLGDLVGQVVFVVEEGRTSQNAIDDALSLLENNTEIGLVLNKSVRSSFSEYSPH